MPPRAKKTDPEILAMPRQKMAVVYTSGDPGAAAQAAMPALFGAVYTLKFQRKKDGNDFKVSPPRVRWPDAHLVPRDQWTGVWGLPIPDDVKTLPQKVPDVPVKVETWRYGTVAQILHIGPYSEEGPSVARLHEFVEESGYVLSGPHEEEYLTRPTAKVMKTIIRYEVKKKRRGA
jgi:hypothetical protein